MDEWELNYDSVVPKAKCEFSENAYVHLWSLIFFVSEINELKSSLCNINIYINQVSDKFPKLFNGNKTFCFFKT